MSLTGHKNACVDLVYLYRVPNGTMKHKLISKYWQSNNGSREPMSRRDKILVIQ